MRFCNSVKARALCLLLLGSLSITALTTSCSTIEGSYIDSAFIVDAEQDKGSSSSNKGNQSAGTYENSSSQIKNESEITSLDQIKPNYTYTKWKGKEYLTIDENSLDQIIELCMDEAENFYLKIGSYNMKLDKNNKVIEGEGNFYPDWMNKEFFKARFKQESVFMVNYRANLSSNINDDPCGIAQINPNGIKKTLEQYFSSVYNVEIRFDDMQVFPILDDVLNINKSEKAERNVTESVKNNILLSIMFDIYRTKCFNPSHTEYYAPYGGYSEELRQMATIAYYLFGNDVVTSMTEGTFMEKYATSVYVQNILKWQKEYEKENNMSFMQPEN